MGTVTISGSTFTIYGAQSSPLAGSALEYFYGSLQHSAAWTAASSATQAAALVSATRLLDRQRWAGEKTSDAQALAWPRTGVTDAEGNAVDSAEIPTKVIQACYEVAAQMVADAAFENSSSASSNIKSVNSGSVGVAYFAPESKGRFPTVIAELCSEFLLGSTFDAGATDGLSGGSLFGAGGLDNESVFDDADAFGVVRGI